MDQNSITMSKVLQIAKLQVLFVKKTQFNQNMEAQTTGRLIIQTESKIRYKLICESEEQFWKYSFQQQSITFYNQYSYKYQLIFKMLEDIETTQTMENNLKRLVKNQNYFSCFFQNREPSNPFQKRLFQKKMRRSTVSCSDNYHQPTQIHQLNNQINQVNNYLQKQQYSRQFEERIQRTTSIVKNQIQLLKEKLLKKQLLIMKDHRISQSKKRMLLRQLAENVQKTTSFIIQNCLHIQESIICPSYEQVQRQSENNKQNLQMNYYKHQMKQQKQIKNLEESDVQLKKAKRNEEKMKQKISCKQRTGAEHQNSNNSSYFSNPISSNSNHHHSCQNKYHLKQMEQKEHKSIYQAVLDERERRLKNIKKKIV